MRVCSPGDYRAFVERKQGRYPLRTGQSLPDSVCSSQLALPGQQEQIGPNPAQGFVVLGAQVASRIRAGNES